MSSASCLLTEEQLLCGICLDVFGEPVTLPCGHNFCSGCITQHWTSSVQFQCPACKTPFYRRLDLRVNTLLSEVAAQFKTTAGSAAAAAAAEREAAAAEREAAAAEREAAGPDEVPCDVCAESKAAALKSCLVCLASYCETHLEPHRTAPRLKKHQLTEPVENLEGRMCPIHDKPLELFCTNDQSCVCMLCPVLDHRAHRVVPLKEQFDQKKSELGRTEAELHRMIRERRLKVEQIKQSVKVGKESADRAMADGVEVFSALIATLERVQAELIGTVEQEQRDAETQAAAYVRQLEEEISALLRRRAEAEQLSRCKDHVHFLQTFPTLAAATQFSRNWSEVRLEPPAFEATVRAAMDRLEETLSEDVKTLLRHAELRRRRQAAREVTLDPRTAHRALVVSQDGRRVHHGAVKKNVPDNNERFDPSCCVLARESVSSGRFYFEVAVGGKTRWTVGVAKQSIKRKGVVPLSPENGHWTVWLKNGSEYAALTGSPLPLPLSPGATLRTVGVFVDYEEGVVSFYDADAAVPLYSFTGCTFTEKLHPFFSPGLSNDGENSAPLAIRPLAASDSPTSTKRRSSSD